MISDFRRVGNAHASTLAGSLSLSKKEGEVEKKDSTVGRVRSSRKIQGPGGELGLHHNMLSEVGHRSIRLVSPSPRRPVAVADVILVTAMVADVARSRRETALA